MPLGGDWFLLQHFSLVQHLMSASRFVQAIGRIVSLVLSSVDFSEVQLLFNGLIPKSSPAYFSLYLTVQFIYLLNKAPWFVLCGVFGSVGYDLLWFFLRRLLLWSACRLLPSSHTL